MNNPKVNGERATHVRLLRGQDTTINLVTQNYTAMQKQYQKTMHNNILKENLSIPNQIIG